MIIKSFPPLILLLCLIHIVFFDPSFFDLAFIFFIIFNFNQIASFFLEHAKKYSYFFLILFPVLWSISYSLSLKSSLIDVYVILIGIIFSWCAYTQKDQVRKGIDHGGNVVILAILSSVAALLIWPQSLLTIQGGNRINGFYKDPNVFAPVIASYYIWYLLNNKKNQQKLSALGLLLAASRSIFPGLLIVICYLLYKKMIKFYDVITSFIFGIISFSIILLLKNASSFFFSLTERVNLVKSYDSLRFKTWYWGYNKFILSSSISKLFGSGKNIFEVQNQHSAHQTYLKVLIEYGVVGLVLYGTFFVFLLTRKTTVDTRNDLFYIWSKSSILIMMISGLFIDINHWRFFWCLVGFSFSYIFFSKAKE